MTILRYGLLKKYITIVYVSLSQGANKYPRTLSTATNAWKAWPAMRGRLYYPHRNAPTNVPKECPWHWCEPVLSNAAL